jgi:ankyrin repeat protein
MKNHILSLRRYIPSTSSVLFILLFVLSISLVNCKGKGDKRDNETINTKSPDASARSQDQPKPAAASPVPQQNSGVDQQMIFDAALNGDLEKVRESIGKGADPNDIDPDGRTALMYASFNGHTEIVRLLLDEGAKVGLRDAMGRTALLFASTGPFAETVELLLDHHADPNITDNDEHFSPLMHAAAEGQLEVVKLLIERGADPAMKDIDGDTAAVFARNNGHTEVAGFIQSVLDAR